MSLKVEEYPRETLEYVPFESVTVNGVPVTTFQYAVTENFARPTTWADVDTILGKQMFLLDAMALGVGTYKVWVKVTSLPEHPVILAGTLKIT